MLPLLASVALAVPTEYPHQGRLLDDTGLPLTGTDDLVFSLFAGQTGGASLWSETQTVTFDQGYYDVSLGAVSALDSALFDGSTLWLEVDIGGSALDRIAVRSVPYAARAGVVDNDADTLAALTCGTDQTALFDGSDWTCGTVGADWGSIDNMPAEFADGDDDSFAALSCGDNEMLVWSDAFTAWGCLPVLDEAAVESFITNGPIDLAAGSMMGGVDIATVDLLDWANLANIPADIADGDADDWSEIANIPADIADGDADDWSEIANIPADIADGDADDWSEIANIPGGFADDVDDDVLGGLSCSSGEIAAWNGSAWACAADQVLDEATVEGMITNGPLSGLVIGDSAATCVSGEEGTIRWDGTLLEICAASGWTTVFDSTPYPGNGTPAAPGASCSQILADNPGSSDGLYTIDIDGSGTTVFQVECDMTNGGWQLAYNRNNAYFSPDHMFQQTPSADIDFTVNSTAWYLPSGSTEWRWEVSTDSGASYREITTAIPAQALATTHATVNNQVLSVTSNTTGASGTFYYQTHTFADTCSSGCGSGGGTWWGIVNVTQGAGDQSNPGFGGHSDSCSMDGQLVAGDNYTWPNGNLEYYLSNWKNIQGNGAGGTNCAPNQPTDAYRYRFWAR